MIGLLYNPIISKEEYLWSIDMVDLWKNVQQLNIFGGKFSWLDWGGGGGGFIGKPWLASAYG